MDACRGYPRLSNARRITFEYVMLKGVNDSPADARALIRLIAGIPAKVNLIPFNDVAGLPYRRPASAAQQTFIETLKRAGISVKVRKRRGADIDAACGQLRRKIEQS